MSSKANWVYRVSSQIATSLLKKTKLNKQTNKKNLCIPLMKGLFPNQVCQTVPMPASPLPVGSTMSTVHLSSDGTYFYWIWSPASLNEKTPKGHSVFMDIFELVVSLNSLCITAEVYLFAFLSGLYTKNLPLKVPVVLSLLSTAFLLQPLEAAALGLCGVSAV